MAIIDALIAKSIDNVPPISFDRCPPLRARASIYAEDHRGFEVISTTLPYVVHPLMRQFPIYKVAVQSDNGPF